MEIHRNHNTKHPSRDELIELSSLFDVEDIYIQTKQHGREKL